MVLDAKRPASSHPCRDGDLRRYIVIARLSQENRLADRDFAVLAVFSRWLTALIHRVG
jgi:hypothetical protein